MGFDLVPWLAGEAESSVDGLADLYGDSINVDMDLDMGMDRNDWLESAKHMEWDASLAVNIQT